MRRFPRHLPRDARFPELPDPRAAGNWLAERDREALAAGFGVTGVRPGYVAYLLQLAERTGGDPDVLLALERIGEINEAIEQARREQDELRDALLLWEEAIDGGWTGVWPLNRKTAGA